MKEYEEAKMEIIRFAAEDIIAASGDDSKDESRAEDETEGF